MYQLSGGVNMTYQKILVGIDGSKQADMAFDKAVETAKLNKAQLYLLSVINGEKIPSGGPNGYSLVDRSIYQPAIDTMEKRLNEYKKKAQAAGITDVVTEVKVGNAKLELAENYPKNNGIDLIVIGATGLNMIGRLIVGSTAAYTIREAPCDVTVVKTDKDNKKVDLKKNSYLEI
ncbi:universal stress family protein [Limosilactobacillus panis DSM 6035]|uniref:Universal stress family protein n=2 Tax=Lactobacillaceae TaxID=33958 RepID=A0A0R1X5J7_9LACO|nr:universal stress family protein [Limosilactobacillus panis DSM 6035]